MRYLLAAVLMSFLAQPLYAQPRTGDFLRGMDANRNGRLEPSEISDRARPYLERFTREAGISLSSSVSISQLEDAARRYYERRGDQGSERRDDSSRSRSSSSSASSAENVTSVRGFGPDENTPLIPGFGPDVNIRFPYTAADEEQAAETLRRYDRNNDGSIDRAEAEGGRWSDNPFYYDFNSDGMLSRIELAQRYARRRIADSSRGQSDAGSSRGDERARDDRRPPDEQRSRDYGGRGGGGGYRGPGDPRSSDGPDRTTYELAYSIIARYDRNRNSKLERPEWTQAGDNVVQADADRDGEITRGELTEWLSRDIQRRYKDFSAELPAWFFERDANGDHQISMSEFTQEWDAVKLEEFAGFDRNGDGFLTDKELLGSRSAVGGTYTNEKAMVIMPSGTVESDIVVEDDYLIGDIDVQLSITHTNVEQLNAYLIGPDEQRVELFTGVGRSDDHFDRTIFDDEAREQITRARPPFQGRFLPEAKDKKAPSLSHFYGKSIHGLWRLEIRTSSGDRPGMLHGWSLIVQRPEELDSDAVADETPPVEDAQRPPPDGERRPPTDEERARYFRERGGESGDRSSSGGGRPPWGRGGPPGFGGERPPGGDGGPPYRGRYSSDGR